MSNSPKEVIIDTDFINKITLAPNVPDGKDLFMRTMTELNVRPVVHYYLAEHEMTVNNPIVKELIDSGYIKVYFKNDFIKDDEAEKLYRETFKKWYSYLNLDDSLNENIDVFAWRKAQHSLGEIHSTLLAYFLNLDIIMSDDYDAKDLVRYSGLRNVKVRDLVDIYSQIGQKEEKSITIKEVQNIICAENSRDSARVKKRKKEKFNRVRETWKK